MNLKKIYLEEVARVAPDAEVGTLHDNADIRDALDLDSMDMLNLLIALHERLDVDIPEGDARQLISVKSAVQYLSKRVPA